MMKFTIHRDEIRDALAKVQGLTGRKTSLAVTETVLINACDTGITLKATDMETGFEGNYPAVVETNGLVVLNAQKLFEIARNFPDEELLIHEVENRWIEIGNDQVQYHIVGMDPDDFPEQPQLENVTFFEMESAVFKQMIDRAVMVSHSQDEKRVHITGVLFDHFEQDGIKKIRFVSTDGSRLTVSDGPYDVEQEPFKSGVLVPKKGLQSVSKFLSSQGRIKIGFKDNKCIVDRDNEKIIIRLLEGDFPKFDEIITRENKYKVEFDRRQFLLMLKRMSILTSDSYRSVLFVFEDDQITVSVTNPELGESNENMKLAFKGEKIEMAFNPRYYIDCLNTLDDENIIMEIINQDMPCLVHGAVSEDFLTVIMPMKI